MKKKFIYLFIFVTATVFAQDIDLNIGETKSKNYFEEFDFEFIRDKIIVPVEIQGVTYKFMLDTGAPNIISKEINDFIKPQLLKTIPITDASGIKAKLKVVSIEKLNFGNIIFENTATLVYDLRANFVFKCFGIDGFIGSNMLRNSIIQIDAGLKKIRLTDNIKNLSLSKKESNKIELIGAQSSPYLWINLQGKKSGKEQVLIDTGMGGLYDISHKHYDVFKKEKIFTEIGESVGASSLGLFGDVPVEKHIRLHLPLLKINELEIENCITNTINDNNSRIGTQLLEYAVITIDYVNKRFYLNPKSKKVNIEKSEFNFTRTLKNEKLIIGFVWDTELNKKISYGDEILEINGKEIEICDLVTQDLISENEGDIKLKVKPQKGEIFEIIINKKLPK
jgi:predicted aspartyl protease